MSDTSESGYPAVRLLLVGLMGSGKTSVGRALSQRLGWPMVDNDSEIARLAGQSTVSLSHAGGETLHEWESAYAAALLAKQPPFVAGLAASSGDRPEELARVRQHALLVYLRCPVEVLVERVKSDEPRPWLEEVDVRDFVEATSQRRDPVFRKLADVVVDGAAPVEAVVEQVLEALRALR